MPKEALPKYSSPGESCVPAQCTPVAQVADLPTHPTFYLSQRADAVAQEGTTKLLEAARSSPKNGTEPALEGAQLLHDAALLRAWQAVRFVSCAAKGQWGINGAFLAPHLLKFLPSLLKLQVLTYSQRRGVSHVRR